MNVNNKKKDLDVLTAETGQGSSEIASLEAAAVDYGSAACSRKDIRPASEICLNVHSCIVAYICIGCEQVFLGTMESVLPQAIVFQCVLNVT